MTEQEKRKLQEDQKKKQVKKEDYRNVITEDGTLASFNFSDNYRSEK